MSNLDIPIRWGEKAERKTEIRLPQLLTAALLGIYIFIQWRPTLLMSAGVELRWYYVLPLAVFIFILEKRRINLGAASVYWIVSLLAWLGGLLSLIRTPDPDQVLYNLIGLAITIVIGYLFLPTLSTTAGRTAFLVFTVSAALMWAIGVERLWLEYGEGIRNQLIGRGNDRNFIGLCLSMGITVLLSIYFYGNGNSRKKVKRLLGRISLLAGAGFMFYAVIHTYSRSSFVVAIIGLLTISASLLFERRFKTFLLFILIIGTLYLYIYPSLIEKNPVWVLKMEEVFRPSDPDTSVYIRYELTRKAWMLIRENPLIGVGANVFRDIDVAVDRGSTDAIPHNTYLGSWAELGVLGLLSNAAFILFWLRELRLSWRRGRAVERTVLLLYPAFFTMQFFLDISTLSNFMLVLLAGFEYQRSYE